MIERKAYQDYVNNAQPKSPMVRTLVAAFIVGGLICCIGEGIGDIIKLIFKEMSEKDVATWESCIMIFLGSLFTALGLYDKLGHYAGGGSIIPITGFANSVVSPAMEYNREGVFFGICAKMFVIAGPIILFGVTASFLVG
ncbi:MAG: SpoVA/SpoVAEb family sporulation membrane protein, partial [[Eubacterium] siraeum]|nr:SpoVA/SpoVAEb family sporulation membrane protein [[Eubacterium] siraeum]